MKRRLGSAGGAVFRLLSAGSGSQTRKKPDFALKATFHPRALGNRGTKMAVLSCPIKNGSHKDILSAERFRLMQSRDISMRWSCSNCIFSDPVSISFRTFSGTMYM